MAYYSDIVVDDQTKAARAGVSITVLKANGTLAALTDGSGAQMQQPLMTNATGFFSFNATDAVYTLEFRYGGRLVREDEVIVGEPPQFVGPPGPGGVDAVLRSDLSTAATTKGSAIVGFKQAGTAAVARTTQDELRDRVSAKQFGAKFDGTTDDTASIQAAIDFLKNTFGGGIVDLPAGTAKVQTLNRPDNVTLQGRHRFGTILVAPTGYNAPMIQAVGSLAASINRGGVQSMTLRGSGMIPGMVGIREVFTDRSTTRDVDFFGMYEGMYAENVWQTRWDSLHVNGAGSDQSRTGFRLGPKNAQAGISNAVNASGCMAQGVQYCGFRLENYDGAKFTSCEGTDGSYGWYLGSPSSGTQACQFGHFVNCLGDTNSINNWRIDKGAASDIRQAQFSNCWGGSAGADGVYIGGASQLVLSGWQVVNSGEHGFNIQLSSRMALTGSHIRDYSSVGGRNGICLSNSQVISMTGNQIYTSKAGSGVAIQEYGTSNYNVAVANGAQGGVTIIGANSIQNSNVNT